MEPWLLRAERRRPRHEALRAGGRSLDYEALAAAARRVAGALPDEGAWVGLAMAPGADFAVALHACLLRGTPAVPIDARLGPDARARITARCAIVLDTLPEGPPLADFPGHDLDSTAVVMHTSGTSAESRSVELTYGNWLWSALGAHVAMGLRDDERWLCALPLSHVGGLSILVRSAIYGTTAIVHERFEVDRALDALRADATVVSLVPTTFARLLDAGLEAPPTLRAALIGGAPIPPPLLERAASANVPTMQTYGLTEACSQVTTDGRPLFCTRVAVAADGEILVAGPTAAPGALDGSWLATGDLGALDGGVLHVTGRKADTIVSGGENVAPAAVEAVLAAHPSVAEVAVHGRADEEWGEAVVATIVLRDGVAPPQPDELDAHCRASLAAYQVPKAFSFASTLPRTPSGKLLRRELS